MPEDELRTFLDIRVKQVKSAVQVVGMAGNSHRMGGIGGSIAATHIVTDFMRTEVSNQVLNQFRGAVTSVAVVSALSALRYDTTLVNILE